MKCDIIIPIWNQLSFTKDCLDNIVANTPSPFRLILVDNASDRDTREFLERFSREGRAEVTLIRNDENLGFVKAVNQGLKAANAPYICVLNNDTIPAPGWLERMIEFSLRHPDAGLINPQCNGHLDTPIATYAKMLEKRKGEYMEMNQCQGFCMLAKKELIDRIGLLDEAFGIGGYDDTDYSMRAHVAGYRSVAICDSYVYHRLHGSFDRAGNREEWVQRNQRIYYAKWGRHLRVGVAVALDRIDEKKIARIMKLVYGLAREWSWVHLWINSPLDKKLVRSAIDQSLKQNGLPPHQNIRIDHFNLSRPLFSMAIAGKTLERMRKRMKDKRFDAIILVDGAASAPVPLSAKLMRALVVDVATDANADDWEAMGKDIVLRIKAKRKAI